MAAHAIRTNYTKWSLPATNGNENEMTLTKPVRLTSCKINWPSIFYFFFSNSATHFLFQKLGFCSSVEWTSPVVSSKEKIPLSKHSTGRARAHKHAQTRQEPPRLAVWWNDVLRIEMRATCPQSLLQPPRLQSLPLTYGVTAGTKHLSVLEWKWSLWPVCRNNKLL